MPKGVRVFSQPVFGSIGYATGAVLGAAAAASENRSNTKRVVLYTGDGSMQLTAQSFADVLRFGLKSIM
jgi:pyruvate decarboxylase